MHVMSVAFSPCGSTIASGSYDSSINETVGRGHGRPQDHTARTHRTSLQRRLLPHRRALPRRVLRTCAASRATCSPTWPIDVVVSFMFGRVHSDLAREAMSVESDSGDGIDDGGRDDDDDDDDEKRGEALLLGGGEEAAVLGVAVGEDEGSN